MLDCRRVSALILRFPDNRRPDLALSHGVHAIGRDPQGLPGPVDDAPAAVAQFCVDRRGVWLRVREGAQGVHVNGRPVRRVAMLRGGDSVYVDGVELRLLGCEPSPPPQQERSAAGDEARIVLRGVGGPNHGRCFGLDRPLAIGVPADGGLHIGDANGDAGGDHHLARLQRHGQGVVLRVGGEMACHVNGWPVREALLRPCDQLVLDSRHRFVLEAPMCEPSRSRLGELPVAELDGMDRPASDRPAVKASMRRVPWLLLAALLLSGALALLLLYGVR